MRIRWLLAVCVFAIVETSTAFGCRYTVRDVGFVQLGSSPYRVYCYIANDTPEDRATTVRGVALAALLDSNVESETINVDARPDHKAMKYHRFWKIDSHPAAILVSPEGQSTVLPLTAAGRPFKEAVWSAMEGSVISPARVEILKHILEAYGTVLLIHGTDAAENARAKTLITGVMGEIARRMPQLPKAIKSPPRLIEIPQSARDREAVLLWALGLTEEDVAQPCVAVLYGRGRRMGPVLRGGEISRTRLLSSLSVIGLSCECGLDRSKMIGPMIPLRWESKLQGLAVEHLGFDAESPLVKMEISQILARGPASGRDSAGGVGFAEDVLGGYKEMTVEIEEEQPAETLSPAQLRNLVSPEPTPVPAAPAEPASSPGASPFRTSHYVIAGLILLLMGGGAFILLGARSSPL